MRSALVLVGNVPSDDGTLAPDSGTPPLRRLAEDLPASIDELVVSCTTDQRDTVAEALDGIDYRPAVEPGTEYRTIAALRTGFRIATGSSVAVFDAEHGRIDHGLLTALFDAVDTAAVPQSEGYLYPLYGVYDRYTGRQAAERTLAIGSDRLYDLLAQIDPVIVDADAADATAALSTSGSRTETTTVIGDSGR